MSQTLPISEAGESLLWATCAPSRAVALTIGLLFLTWLAGVCFVIPYSFLPAEAITGNPAWDRTSDTPDTPTQHRSAPHP